MPNLSAKSNTSFYNKRLGGIAHPTLQSKADKTSVPSHYITKQSKNKNQNINPNKMSQDLLSQRVKPVYSNKHPTIIRIYRSTFFFGLPIDITFYEGIVDYITDCIAF